MENKKKLGIIGGMGSRAGVLFLQKIIDYSPAATDQDFLEIVFHNNSGIPDRTKAIVYNEPSPLEAIRRSLDIFNQNKIEVIALACITSYYYYEQIRCHTAAKVMNPLNLVAEHIRKEYSNAARIGVLATTGTINSGLFHRILNNSGLETVTLDPPDQEEVFMRAVYMKDGFKSARISGEAKYLMNRSVEKIIGKNVDIIIGGCTETSIGIDPGNMPVPFIDALDLLARKTVHHCYDAKYINAEVHG